MNEQFYKIAMPSGWDFYTGKTINYRENIGKTVQVPDSKGEPKLCSPTVIHASRHPALCFIGGSIPCSLFKVRGKPLIEDKDKAGFKELFIIEEVPEDRKDEVFGFKYIEACNPVNPCNIEPKLDESKALILLRRWASVRASVRASVWAPFWDSVWAPIRDSVGAPIRDSFWDSFRASVWDSFWDSVWAPIRDSVGDSFWDSVGDSVWAYGGSLFPNIKEWKYMNHKKGDYPFQSAVDLWKQGLIPVFDGKKWYLVHPIVGKPAQIMWSGALSTV